VKRILFVDDEPKILDALRRTLHSKRNEWDIAFAIGGEAALGMMEAAPFDVVVSDMRMPGMDGAALLQQVRDRYPNVLRIILSGCTELEAVFRAVPVAHQFLLKPCQQQALQAAIDRATSLTQVLNSKLLIGIVGSMQDLPSLPRTYVALRSAISNANTGAEQLASIVEQDPAISAKLLQLVNSAFFGVAREITEIKAAITYIGIHSLQSLVLSVEVFRAYEKQKHIPGFSLDEFQSHCQLTAKIAGGLRGVKALPGSAVVAGLLHDIGKLVLIERTPEHFARALAGARQERRPLFAVEEELMGVSHAEVGAYLLSLWGIPYPVVEAVAHHHHPERVSPAELDLLSAVYIANSLAHERDDSQSAGDVLVHVPLDMAVIAKLRLEDRLEGWRALAGSAERELQGTKK